MPELPDVEMLKRYFYVTSLHRRVSDVRVRDVRILKGVSASSLKRCLLEKSFESTHRHGKYLFAKTNREAVLVLHFGMSGSLRSFKDTKRDPKYDRILLSFEDGFHLAILSQRLLGGVWITDSKDTFLREHALGPDALSVDQKTFQSIITKTKGGIKSKLMNQKLIAGIGNIYADEILFQSRIHPLAESKELKDKDISRLYHKMNHVLQIAVDRHADPAQFPFSWIVSHRIETDKCPRCRGRISKIKAASRTSYFCSSCQNI